MPLQSSFAGSALTLKQQLGQKLMLDLRYYCPQGDGEQTCRTPVTSLPNDLADLITKHNIGGVILFAENIANIAQVITLNDDLQHAAAKSTSGLPLFISIDQEGGRVARIPRDIATSFTGNMSIGASYQVHGTQLATASAQIIAKELKALGINVNYAPTVDVNMNPDNPVINVRSYGEDPQLVAELGGAQVTGFESNGIISSLKHFPGHGDTNVDSHTGLPKVMHDKATIWQQDLAPFKAIIAKQNPGMVMTAHIQYPALDDTTFVSKAGKTMIKPATMSRKIITDLLRTELGYQGVVITDALDMAGISHFFDPIEAVINTFSAGVDIALMPIEIRNPNDLANLDKLIARLESEVNQGQLNADEIAASAQRILKLKNKFKLSSQLDKKTALANADLILGANEHRQAEAQLALAAVTEIKNNRQTLPLNLAANSNVHIIMPDTRKCIALQYALAELTDKPLSFSCTSLQGYEPIATLRNLNAADVVIAAHASPKQSAVEVGGMDDLADDENFSIAQNDQPAALESLLKQARQAKKKIVFVSLRAPYDIAQFGQYGDAVLATYAYNIDVDNGQHVSGPAFTALAKVLLGKATANGQLPVTIKNIN
ncbi:glycoside hydrolase family 3 N-terminal domain-containing protein [Pseudoalteromonas mariniglutinosa]|uniref:glycoside hydrolase family 3 protein n=1 Tax=Pseudoalteromonas mariniglutinosa TaxID=206042 RepID=UPI00384F6B4C